VTEHDVSPGADHGAQQTPASAGALLRGARESMGMTIDAVAQQLKLAPRQVRALEDGDYTHLPGRTFVRGFFRNYARLVHLDPDAVLAALSAGTPASNLESPALHATAPTIGELPTTEPSRHGWTRWAIPLTLIAIIAATAAWEWLHPAAESPRAAKTQAAPARAAGAAKAIEPEVVGTPLPNPVATAPSVAAALPPPVVAASAPPTIDASEPAPETRPYAGPAIPDAPLVLAFRDYSWTEVKDRSGRVLLSRMNPGGSTQALAGAPPLDVVIGNAADVTLTWKGKRVDLAPHTRQNVARFTLE
jgi:cytoskeleton protein RodZ